MKQYKKLDTYYYDYHVLQMSLETSKISLDALTLELKDACIIGSDKEVIKHLEKRIKARQDILTQQEELLFKMGNIINGFPEKLKDVEYSIYKAIVIEQKTVAEISFELGYSQQYVRLVRSAMQNKFINFVRMINS